VGRVQQDNRFYYKQLCVFLIISIVIWIVGVATSHCMEASFNARVSYVIDGDSIIVKKKKQKTRIRLWGIDTPEKSQPFSREAQRFTRRLLQGRTVKLIPVERDDYGRLVAIVLLGRKNISEELVRSGLAWVHIYYCRKKICESWRLLEEAAREAKSGLWNDNQPIAPWKWKKGHNHKP